MTEGISVDFASALPYLEEKVRAWIGRDATTKAARELVEKHLLPEHVHPPPKDPRWNYLTGIHTKWHRSFFYFIGVYASPGPNALSPTFESRFARLEYVGGGRFNLAYMRHTGQWWPVGAGLPLDRCLAAIRDDPTFTP